ncbi:hypothetical protein Syun_009591 [Stephania yunnanensis]|uniref:Uncharacterized protein n=1 Tax=Stephania yunnanensis TaxID=152371 RepID=A0AAP0PP64_9MAGN
MGGGARAPPSPLLPQLQRCWGPLAQLAGPLANRSREGKTTPKGGWLEPPFSLSLLGLDIVAASLPHPQLTMAVSMLPPVAVVSGETASPFLGCTLNKRDRGRER